jgi:uncharacterized membrane protein
VKNIAGISMGIAVNIHIALDPVTIFAVLILLFHEHGRSFHLLMSSSISSSVIYSFHCLSLPLLKLILSFCNYCVVESVLILISLLLCELLFLSCIFFLCFVYYVLIIISPGGVYFLIQPVWCLESFLYVNVSLSQDQGSFLLLSYWTSYLCLKFLSLLSSIHIIYQFGLYGIPKVLHVPFIFS